MGFEIRNIFGNRKFNLVRFRYFFLASAILFFLFKMYVSFKDYTEYNHHRVEVIDFKYRNRMNDRIISSGELAHSVKTVYTIKAENYWTYFVLEFNPDDRTPFSLFFLINFIVVAVIVFYATRKSTNEKIFTRELLTGLNYLRRYIIIIMVLKFIQEVTFRNYIDYLSNHEVYSLTSSNFDIIDYQIYLLLFIFLISVVQEGIRLQIQESLTI
jgi:hypothetical protein